MEKILLLTCSTITILIVIPLLVRMSQKGFGIVPRLYVALFGASLMVLSQSVITGHRLFGYLPEMVLSGLVAMGFIAALVAAYRDPDRSQERTSVFHNLF